MQQSSFFILLVFGWALTALLNATDSGASTAAQITASIPDGYVLYVTQPNGWGDTKEAAIRDLRKRILPWYQKTFGNRPGFYVDWSWYALVEVADGREWQADGRVGWYVPKAVAASPKPKRSKFSHLRTK
ncbi:MAG: hypothetical protein AAF649_00860 [Verrucomicrobiota bacterium]